MKKKAAIIVPCEKPKGKKYEIEGKTFMAWRVIVFLGNTSRGRMPTFLCRCIFCEKEAPVCIYNLLKGCTCRCRARTTRTHGLSKTEIYFAYHQMKKRCCDPNHRNYNGYGGRGITVCERWKVGENEKSGFECFMEDMGTRPEGMTIERINNNGPYSPENCRWATMLEQSLNTRRSRILEYNGKRQNVKLWSDELGIPHHVIRSRLHYGWSTERTLTQPVRPTPKRKKALLPDNLLSPPAEHALA